MGNLLFVYRPRSDILLLGGKYLLGNLIPTELILTIILPLIDTMVMIREMLRRKVKERYLGNLTEAEGSCGKSAALGARCSTRLLTSAGNFIHI